MTLIELLVVLGIMGVLVGLGVSMFTNMGRQGVFSVSVTKVLHTLNLVRNSSMHHPAALQIRAGDPEGNPPGENSVRGIQFVTMFQSQCEPPVPPATDEIQGSEDRNGRIPGGATFVPGVLGKALFLEGGGSVDCGKYAAYDATEGISIDLWLHPTALAGGTVVRRGQGFALSTTRKEEGLGVKLDLLFAAESPGSEGKADSTFTAENHFETEEGVLPLHRWSRVVAIYDRTAVTILVDTGRGPVERKRVPEKSPLVPSRDANLTLGGGQGSAFRGYIDDVRIEGVLGEAYDPLPPQVLVEPREGPRGKTKDWRIRFTGGRLDPAFHTRPESIVIVYGARRKRITVGLEGNITEITDETRSSIEAPKKPL